MDPPPRIVIVGAGFGGLWAAKRLAKSRVDILVLDRNNYHTFLPLLYQVAAAELEPETIVFPVRGILRGHDNLRVVMDEMAEIDPAGKVVRTGRHIFPYDFLILATGSTTAFYGVAGASEHAFELKTLNQAVHLRNHILLRFERALDEPDPETRKAMLTFTIIGGGPTGVEYAGALAELFHGPLKKDYPNLKLPEVRLVLLEAADTLLPGLPEKLQRYALQRLSRMGVEVRLRSKVRKMDGEAVYLEDGSLLQTETIVWTAGIRGEPIPSTQEFPVARNGRIQVLPTLQLPAHPDVYVVGDVAYLEEPHRPLPMVAPVAIQQGEWSAENILRQLEGLEPLPFRYRDPGTMVTIGRNAAVVLIRGLALTGFVAWLIWVVVHLYKLIGFRNRFIVFLSWALDYFFYERAVRLIIPLPGAGKMPRLEPGRTRAKT